MSEKMGAASMNENNTSIVQGLDSMRDFVTPVLLLELIGRITLNINKNLRAFHILILPIGFGMDD